MDARRHLAEHAQAAVDELVTAIKATLRPAQIEVSGDLRRGLSRVTGAVPVLLRGVAAPALNDWVFQAHWNQLVHLVMADVARGRWRVVHRETSCSIELRIVSLEELPLVLLATTGPTRWWDRLAAQLSSRGYLLTETELFGLRGKKLRVRSERGFFQMIKRPYEHPTERQP